MTKKEPKVRFHITMDKEVKEAVKKAARDRQDYPSYAQWIVEAIQEKLEREK